MAVKTPNEFCNYIGQVVQHGFISIGLSIGGRLGLFKLLASFNEPKTAQEVAQAGGFKERYMREWLNLMTVAKIIEADKEGKRFFLPEHHQKVLTERCSEVVMATKLPLLGEVEDRLSDCFTAQGAKGFPYSLMTKGPTWMRNFSLERLKYEGDVYQKIPELHSKLEKGALVADMGCGDGVLTIHVAKKYPKSSFLGVDLEESVIAKSNNQARDEGINNLSFEVKDICRLPADWTDKWDCVMMQYCAHDLSYTTKAFQEVLRTLKPGGLFFLCEPNAHTNVAQNVDLPFAPIMYSISLFACVPCSLNENGGEALGAMWGKEKAMDMIQNAGFEEVYEAYEGPWSFFVIAKKKKVPTATLR